MTNGVEAAILDYPALVAGLLGSVEAGGSASPLEPLGRLVETLATALGAAAGSFVVYGAGRGRVLVATEDYRWVLGRPVDVRHPSVARTLTEDCVEFDVRRDAPAELAGHLAGHGLQRAVTTRACVRQQLIGVLHLYFRDPDGGPLTADQRTALQLGAQLAGRVSLTVGAPDGGPTAEPGGTGPAADPFDAGRRARLVGTPIAVLGADDRVRSWNPAAQAVTGVPALAVAGRPVPFPVPEPGEFTEHQLPDGRWIQVFCSPLAGGRPDEAADRVLTFRDITQERDREQAKELCVATTSHELRTPVTVVRGYAETLDRRWDQLDEPTRRDLVRAIRQRSERLAVLVDRLLLGGEQDARVDALLALAPFDLVATLRLAAGRLADELTGRLVLRLPDRLPKALGDAGSVPTVLTELVQNAHKYSPDGGEITVTAGADEATAYFRVTDRGIGVQADHVERAFERFWQAEGSDRRRFGGLGLGLYLVRRLVERQNGWVSLRPYESGGTVAEVRLPRAGVTSGEA
jgi:two-component system phosphate regulon sensor histidine kinase PhoR